MSRLLPMPELARFTEVDPWDFDPHEDMQYVFMRDRETKNEIEFDPSHPTAVRYQKRLRRINKVNAGFKIIYRPLTPEGRLGIRRQLRPVHYARFTDDFDLHGRIYTGHYGQQALRKIERQTIEFETEPHFMEPNAELDYGGLHPRLAYHLAGIDYRRDPYALWGDNTTPPMRLMAKTLINALLNAKSPEAAIADCNFAMSSRTANKNYKTGKALHDAIQLLGAASRTRLKFSEIYPLAMQKHRKIADQFCSDAGMRLMRIDSEIALRIMYYFAKRDVPCLGVHDSFIVPISAKSELRRLMRKFYRKRLGFNPVIK